MDSKKRNLILMILCIVGLVILLSIMVYNVVFAGSKKKTKEVEVIDNNIIEDDVDVEKEIDLNSIVFDPSTYKLDEKLAKDGTFINKYAGLIKDGSNILDDVNYRILYVNYSLITGNKYSMALGENIISSGYVVREEYINEYNKYFGKTYLYSKTVDKEKIQQRFYNDCEDYPSVNNGRNVCFITNISEYPETYFLGLKIKDTKKVRIYYGAYYQDNTPDKSGVYDKGYFKIVYKKFKYDLYLQSITFKKAA